MRKYELILNFKKFDIYENNIKRNKSGHRLNRRSH